MSRIGDTKRNSAAAERRASRRRTRSVDSAEPMLWLTGGGLAISLLMILGLLAVVLWFGMLTFWPGPVVELKLIDGRVMMGELSRTESFRPPPDFVEGLAPQLRGAAQAELDQSDGTLQRSLLRTGNFELSGEHFHWVSDFEVAERNQPEWAFLLERVAWGRFYGNPESFLVDGDSQALDPREVWGAYHEHRGATSERLEQIAVLEHDELGTLNRALEEKRLALRGAERAQGADSALFTSLQAGLHALEEETAGKFAEVSERIAALRAENARYELALLTADGTKKKVALADIVRAVTPNRLGTIEKVGVYFSRWGEFFLADPREANSEGGVWPAIFGTVSMTLVMSFFVTPLGVLAALYLREYAKQGLIVSAVRIAVNNLAGVPSIVYGVFGLGFFCYIVGGSIDEVLFSSKLPSPTFGTGGILWASLTLALLTLPVVIVATEEALAAVPSSMREGSYACGASKWQTIQRIVLPRAMPGIMTGMILSIARGAGEVAPLMLVGAVKLAPELPVDGIAPFVHLERSFMHLGFHIYDLGFQSQNSEAAKPMVYTTTLLLVGLIASLNVAAIGVRARLRRRFVGSQF